MGRDAQRKRERSPIDAKNEPRDENASAAAHHPGCTRSNPLAFGGLYSDLIRPSPRAAELARCDCDGCRAAARGSAAPAAPSAPPSGCAEGCASAPCGCGFSVIEEDVLLQFPMFYERRRGVLSGATLEIEGIDTNAPRLVADGWLAFRGHWGTPQAFGTVLAFDPPGTRPNAAGGTLPPQAQPPARRLAAPSLSSAVQAPPRPPPAPPSLRWRAPISRTLTLRLDAERTGELLVARWSRRHPAEAAEAAAAAAAEVAAIKREQEADGDVPPDSPADAHSSTVTATVPAAASPQRAAKAGAARETIAMEELLAAEDRLTLAAGGEGDDESGRSSSDDDAACSVAGSGDSDAERLEAIAGPETGYIVPSGGFIEGLDRLDGLPGADGEAGGSGASDDDDAESIDSAAAAAGVEDDARSQQ